jgi:autotransporter-associated beta strand protein
VASGATLNLNNFSQTIGSLAGAGLTTLGSASLTVGGNNSSIAYSGSITGTGGVNKTGAGTFILTGTSGYSGPTNVNGGTLEVDGAITSSSSVSVNAGGTLAGSGLIDSSIVTVSSGATLAPGTPGVPGTALAVTGNLAFQSGATYMVQINAASTTVANVTGTASLAGDVLAAIASGGGLKKQYDILHSAGLNGTTFAGLATIGLPTAFTASLSYSTTDAFLNLTTSFAQQPGLNQNQQNVANVLETFFNRGGTLPASVLSIFGSTGTNLANGLSQLDGEAATGAEKGAFQLMTQFLGVMLDPFVYGRGVGGAIGFAPDQQASLPPDIALAYAGVLKAPPLPSFAQPWTAWGASYGGSGTTNGDPVVGSTNVTAQTFGFAGGMDYHYSPDTIFGFALAGGGTNWGLAQNLGGGRSDAFQAGIYGITRAGPTYLAAALAFTNNWFTTNRNALGDQLTANFDGQSFGGRVEAGYRYAVLPTSGITPYAALQTQTFHTPAYSETDLSGGGLGLSFNAMNAMDTRSELGARFDDPTLVGGMPLVLRARIAWAHEWVSNPALAAVFESLGGGSFVVNGAAPPQNSALVSAGAELFLSPRLSLIAKFDGEFGHGSETYAGSGTVRYAW